MTARQLSDAMFKLDMTAGELAKITGTNIARVQKWLKGDEDISVFVQRDFYVWARDPQALQIAADWASEHAHDLRTDDDEAPTSSHGNP